MFGKLLGGVFDNKTVLNSALGMLRGWIQKDGLSGIVITPGPEDSDTPGVSVKIYKTEIGVLDGEDLNEYLRLRELKAELRASQDLINADPHSEDAVDEYLKCCDRLEKFVLGKKEVSDGL